MHEYLPVTTSPIFLISGPPGAGKTTLASMLMQRYPFGLHIPVDDLRDWVVAGIAHPLPAWTDESDRQFRLARQAAARVARLYVGAGFAVAIDDVILPDDFGQHYEIYLQSCSVYKILLLPNLRVALERNSLRINKDFDPQVLAGTIRSLSVEFAQQVQRCLDWVTIDSSDLSPAATVELILKKTTGHAL